jgi:hypothetical protein
MNADLDVLAKTISDKIYQTSLGPAIDVLTQRLDDLHRAFYHHTNSFLPPPAAAASSAHHHHTPSPKLHAVDPYDDGCFDSTDGDAGGEGGGGGGESYPEEEEQQGEDNKDH